MAEKEGFEPPRRRRPPGFQDRSLQPDLGISPFFKIQMNYSTNKLSKSTKNLKFFYFVSFLLNITLKTHDLLTKKLDISLVFF